MAQYAEVTSQMTEYRVTVEAAAHRLVVDPSFHEEYQANQRLERLRKQQNKRIDESRRASDMALNEIALARRTTLA